MRRRSEEDALISEGFVLSSKVITTTVFIHTRATRYMYETTLETAHTPDAL